MKKVLLTTIGIVCLAAASFSQANVFDPNDPVANYNASAPPVNPGIDKIVKWVRTPRVGWNTSRFKPYFLNDMAFRLRYPNGFNATDTTKKYPLIFFLHGGGEIAPVTDNEFQLLWGAQMFEQMINEGKFNAFLLFPQQTQVGWEETYFTRINMVIDSLTRYANVDPDRIIPMGLSIGGNGVLYYTTLYPKRTATAIPSAPSWIEGFDAHQQKFIHIPTWVASGGLDPNPHPALVQRFVETFRAQGGDIRWSFFPSLGHLCWNEQWSEPVMATYWNNAHKANPHVFFNQKEFCPDTQVNARIGITPGFYAYEWQKDGTTIAERTDQSDNILDGSSLESFTGNEIVVKTVGVYRVRFKRTGDSKWSAWSPKPAVISHKKYTITPDITITGLKSKVLPAADGSTTVPLELPAGYASYEWKDANTGDIVSTVRNFNAPAGQYIAVVTEAGSCGAQASPLFTVTDATGHPAPDDITDLAATRNTAAAAELTWSQNASPTAEETGFEIYRSTTAGGPYTLIAITPANSSSYISQGLAANLAYYYVVRAVNETGGSALSNEAEAKVPLPAPDVTAPTAPANVNATAITTVSITLDWDNSTDNVAVAGYDVYMNGVKKFSTTTSDVVATDLLPNSSYSFTVKAFDAAGNQSVESAVLSAKTAQVPDVTSPSVPANLSVVSVTTTSVNLNWDDATDNIAVTAYDVYVNGVKKYTSATSELSATGLIPNTTYSFTVKAVDGAGNNSPFSNAVSARTNAVADVIAPSVPANLRVLSTALTSVTLDWDNATDNVGVTGYDVYVNDVKRFTSLTSDVVVTGLVSNTTYTFSVKAVDQAGNASGFSNAITAQTTTVDVTAPAAPANLKVVSVTATSIQLDWDNAVDNVGVMSYDVFVNGVKRYASTTSSLLVTGLASNTSYLFTVKAMDLAGNISVASNAVIGKTAIVDKTAPTVPSGLKVVSATNTSIGLDWNSSTDNIAVAGYDVYVNGIKKFTASSSSFVVTNLTRNTGYYFAVKAFDQAGNYSALSGTIYGKTTNADVTPPIAPKNLAAIITGKTYVALYWEKSTDNVAVAGYQVFVNGVKKYATAYNGILATELTPGTSYNFTVKAIDAAGNLSPESNQLTITTKTDAGSTQSLSTDDDGSWSWWLDNNRVTAGIDVTEQALETVAITKAYPSPFVDRLTIDFNNTGSESKVDVQFYDMYGQLAFTERFGNLNAGKSSVTIHFNNKQQLRAGMYLVRLNVDGVQTKLMKVVKSDK